MTVAQTAFPRSLEEPRSAVEGDSLTVRRSLRLVPIEGASGELQHHRPRHVSLEVLARKPGRSRPVDEGTIHKARAQRIFGSKFGYVYHESFDAPDAERTILGSRVAAPIAASGRMNVPAGLPPYLASLFRDATLLSREQEIDLFRRMNYLKHRAWKLREGLDPTGARSTDLDEIERLLDEVLVLKNQIVRANLRLVVAIAKKRVGPAADLFELISDGNMSLMQAVEKFDFARGFKFSTYASWAIMRNFARSLPAEKERRERFVTGLVEHFEVAADAHDEQQFESDLNHERESMQTLLGRLSDRERQILVNRYGLDGADKLTLQQLGHAMGITKERVRQIEVRAQNKLRKFAWIARSASSD